MQKKVNFLLLLLVMVCGSSQTNSASQKQVMVFGVFDLYHKGHEYFLKEANTYGNLVIVVTRDCLIKALKKNIPVEKEEKRLQKLKQHNPNAIVILGDSQLSDYSIIKQYQPDIICFGYDQQALEKDIQLQLKQGKLKNLMLVYLKPFLPEEYHTSIIRKLSNYKKA